MSLNHLWKLLNEVKMASYSPWGSYTMKNYILKMQATTNINIVTQSWVERNPERTTNDFFLSLSKNVPFSKTQSPEKIRSMEVTGEDRRREGRKGREQRKMYKK